MRAGFRTNLAPSEWSGILSAAQKCLMISYIVARESFVEREQVGYCARPHHSWETASVLNARVEASPRLRAAAATTLLDNMVYYRHGTCQQYTSDEEVGRKGCRGAGADVLAVQR